MAGFKDIKPRWQKGESGNPHPNVPSP